MKTIDFRGEIVTVEDARKMVIELTTALAVVDPVLTNSPVGQTIPTILDPRWYTEIAQASSGSLLCFRDPGIGWCAFIIPWAQVGELIGLLSRQMAVATEKSLPTTQIH